MNNSPYSSDRSLLLAIGILTGGAVLCAGGFYVLSFLSPTSTGGGSMVGVQGRIPASSGQTPLVSRRSPRSSPPAAEEGPAWARSTPGGVVSGASRAPRTTSDPYMVEPDFGHAELGGPSGGAARAPSGGVAIAGTGGSDTDPTPSASDLSARSFGGQGAAGDASQWRSEAQTLASRTRALSNALGRIDRAGSREGASSRSKSEEGGSPGEATTASGTGTGTTSDPDTPGDPNQVPLGGPEWLAAAGAAYALNRLRERDGDEPESGDDA